MANQKENISGLLLIDKQQGLTSNQALQDVKYLLNAKKAGHTGSLDPLATGLLPLCFGEATKLSCYLLDADKTYVATFALGECTDSGDAEGKITRTREVNVTREQIEKAMASMVGTVNQIPPMFSALKKDGTPLYVLARKGVEIERKPRRVQLYTFDFIELNEHELKVSIRCSSGFYVRSLAHDLGELLGCGAHVSSLRRTSVGMLNIDAATSIAQLRNISDLRRRQELLIAADTVLTHMQSIELNEPQAVRLFQGQSVQMNGLPANGLVRLYLQPEDKFLGVGLVIQGYSIKPKRLVNPQSVNL